MQAVGDGRSGFRRSIGSLVEDRDLAAHLENAGGFFQYGSAVVEFMPDICSKQEIATACRKARVISFCVDQVNIRYSRLVKLMPQEQKHLILGIHVIDLAVWANSQRQW